MAKHAPGRFVSRGGEKLDAALAAFAIDVHAMTCADFGSHVGGFVDCLLQRGAAKVYAIDPGYGVLAYSLRRDPRVVVCERTNALDYRAAEPVDLVTLDVGWTPQRLILPVAARCLKSAGNASLGVVSLVKPHYEAPPEWLDAGVVRPDRLDEVLTQCEAEVREMGWRIAGRIESPITGHGGNREWLWWLQKP